MEVSKPLLPVTLFQEVRCSGRSLVQAPIPHDSPSCHLCWFQLQPRQRQALLCAACAHCAGGRGSCRHQVRGPKGCRGRPGPPAPLLPKALTTSWPLATPRVWAPGAARCFSLSYYPSDCRHPSPPEGQPAPRDPSPRDPEAARGGARAAPVSPRGVAG